MLVEGGGLGCGLVEEGVVCYWDALEQGPVCGQDGFFASSDGRHLRKGGVVVESTEKRNGGVGRKRESTLRQMVRTGV